MIQSLPLILDGRQMSVKLVIDWTENSELENFPKIFNFIRKVSE